MSVRVAAVAFTAGCISGGVFGLTLGSYGYSRSDLHTVATVFARSGETVQQALAVLRGDVRDSRRAGVLEAQVRALGGVPLPADAPPAPAHLQSDAEKLRYAEAHGGRNVARAD